MNPAGKNCTVTRTGRLWDAILVTDDGFGALMCQKRAQSQIRLGEWGGGDTIGGGGGRRTENFDHIYIYISLSLYLFIFIYYYILFRALRHQDQSLRLSLWGVRPFVLKGLNLAWRF